MEKKQILSCIQPTGEPHLGNYFGAIKKWVELQLEHDCLYGVVDYHAMTMPYTAQSLREYTICMATDLIACGIEPKNIFIQSLVPEHTELAWILSCLTPYGELARQTQFKTKARQSEAEKALATCGLFTYPVLQAADILMYHADLVPVGTDQEQHLELSRTIANRFNQQFDCDYFKAPQCLFTVTPKIMSLSSPDQKMSKSLGAKHYIGVFDDEATIRAKVKQAVTDGTPGGDSMSAGVFNMFELLKASGNEQVYEQLQADYKHGNLKYQHLKDELAQSLIALNNPLRRSRHSLLANPEVVEKRIINASNEIRQKAKKTLREVKQLVGLFN